VDLRERVNNDEWIINGVTNLIINSYNNKKVKLNENMKDQLDAFKSGDDTFEKLNESFEITRNDKDRLDNNIMKEHLKANNSIERLQPEFIILQLYINNLLY
jgi:hypothetical protein